ELDDLWNSLVHHPVAKHLLLALPPVLIRKPYQQNRTTPRYSHEESVDGSDSSKLLWGSPLWPIAAQLAQAFFEGSWCADLAAGKHTSICQSFPSLSFQSEEGDLYHRGPLEVALNDTALYLMHKSGFTVLSSDTGTNRAVIPQARTLYQAPSDTGQDPQDPHLLRDTIGRCRLEQYIISIAREVRTWA